MIRSTSLYLSDCESTIPCKMSFPPSDARLKGNLPRAISDNSEALTAGSEDYLAHYLNDLFHEPENEDETKNGIASPELRMASVNEHGSQITSPSPNIAFTLPGCGGLKENPTSSDVRCGRGKRINSHEGNIRFREIVTKQKLDYLVAPKTRLGKSQIVEKVVAEVRKLDPPGGFLEADEKSGLWIEIGDTRAMRKSAQALREDSHAFCKKWEPEHVKHDISASPDHAIGRGLENTKQSFEITQKETEPILRDDTLEAHKMKMSEKNKK